MLLVLGALAGCSAAAGGAGPAQPRVVDPSAVSAAQPAADRQILHALNRLTYGPRPGDFERVRAIGLSAWIDRQLRPQMIYDSATERALAELTTLRMPILELLREYPRPDPKLREKIASGAMTRQEMQERYPMEKRPIRIAAELQAAKVVRAVTSERQLRKSWWISGSTTSTSSPARATCAGTCRPTSARRSGPTRWGRFPTWCAPPRAIPQCSSISTTGSAPGRTSSSRRARIAAGRPDSTRTTRAS